MLMVGGGVKNHNQLSDVIFGRSLILSFSFNYRYNILKKIFSAVTIFLQQQQQ